MLLKISWVTKRNLKTNLHKRLLDLFHFRFKINLKCFYLLHFPQLDVKNDQVRFAVPASSQRLSHSSPQAPAVTFELQAVHSEQSTGISERALSPSAGL